jgi:predicted transcriptional regulator
MRRSPRKPTQLAEQAANSQARLAWDLAVLIESGLVVPVRDGATIRYAVNPTGDPAAA